MSNSRDKFTKELDTNLYKITEAYRTLLKKAQIDESYSNHEAFQIETASASLVTHAQAILDQIHDLRMHILLQQQVSGDSVV